MLETFVRVSTSKGWYSFWYVWSVFFFTIDVIIGSPVAAVVMAVLAVFWGYQLYTAYKGTNVAHNRYHGTVGK